MDPRPIESEARFGAYVEAIICEQYSKAFVRLAKEVGGPEVCRALKDELPPACLEAR